MVALIVVGVLVEIAVVVRVARRAKSAAHEIREEGGDTAPGWVLRCTTCQSWRPATEVGIVRLGAAGIKKYTLGRCSACSSLSILALEKGPGPEGRRRIDDRTNETIWPETLLSNGAGDAKADSR
ncbi:MAG: hypothetical protein AAGF47_09090 [Planctomycetota bacterium]